MLLGELENEEDIDAQLANLGYAGDIESMSSESISSGST